MVTDLSSEIGSEYPPEVIRYATDEAERDAEEVADWLTAAGLAPARGETRDFPPCALLDLGAVVRLRRWEAAGYSVHPEAGLPTAREAMRQVIDSLVAADADRTALATAGSLARSVFHLTVTRFAWAARPHLGEDVLLAVADEDAFVEALVQFLWDRRRETAAAVVEEAL